MSWMTCNVHVIRTVAIVFASMFLYFFIVLNFCFLKSSVKVLPVAPLGQGQSSPGGRSSSLTRHFLA
jgi:hypothetical protein